MKPAQITNSTSVPAARATSARIEILPRREQAMVDDFRRDSVTRARSSPRADGLLEMTTRMSALSSPRSTASMIACRVGALARDEHAEFHW